MAPKNTLKNAIVIGPYEYVAILILKKDDPHIKPREINKNMSKVLASLISSLDCMDVKIAQQIYFNIILLIFHSLLCLIQHFINLQRKYLMSSKDIQKRL